MAKVKGSALKTLLPLAGVLIFVMAAALLAVMDLLPHPEVSADDGVGEVPQSGPEDVATDAPTEGDGDAGTQPKPDVSGLPKVDAAIAAQLRGRVRLYKTKEPVAGLPLTLTTPDGAQAVVKTGKDGAFRFPSLPPIAGYELAAAREPYAPIHRTGIDLAPQQRLDLGTLWLEVPVDLAVLVTDSQGIPVHGATVSVFSTGRKPANNNDGMWSENREQRILSLTSTPKPTGTAKTGDDGQATVTGLSPGTYRVVAEAEGRAKASRDGLLLTPDAALDPIRLLLGKGNDLGGHVYDKDGKPVEGAAVIAVPGNSWSVGLDKWETTSSADGEYELTGLRGGQITLYLVQEGKPLLQVGSVRVPDTTRFDIRLRPTGSIRGTITDDEGKPVAGAEVRISIQATWSPMNVESNADGTYLIEDVPAGALGYFKVNAEGFAPFPDPSAPRQGSGQSLREGVEMIRDVVLRRGVSASLTVRSKEDNKPIEGAEVRLILANQWGNATPWSAATDAEGLAEVKGLVPGSYLVLIRAEGYVQEGMPPWYRNTFQSEDAMPARWRLTIDADGDADGVEYELARGSSVSGRVVDKNGTPVAGAQVTVPGAQPLSPVFTDAEGKYTVDAVPPNKRSIASASAPGKPSGVSEPFIVEPGAPVTDIEIKLAGGATVRGTVRSEDGSKFEGAVVRWVAGKHNPDNQWARQQFDVAQTWPVDANGHFVIEGIKGGEVGTDGLAITLRAEAQGFLPAWNTDVKVRAEDETAGIEIILSPPLRIKGRVESETGEPVAGALVQGQYQGDGKRRMWNGVQAGPAQTDENGEFELKGLKAGEYNLWPSAPGFAAGSRKRLATGAGDVLLTLARGKVISGVVRDESNQPVSGIPVNANKTDNTGGQDWWYSGGWGQVYTAPDGTFEMRDMADGTYRLTVSASWQWGREINVEDVVMDGISAGRTDVEITVKTGQIIQGKLIDQDEKAVRTGWLQASFQGGQGNNWRDMRWSQVKSDGTFRISGLRPGPYTINAYGSFKYVQTKGVAAGTNDLEIRVEPGFAIGGQIVDDDGFSLPGGFNMRVRKSGEDKWQWQNTITPGDGTFVIVGLSEGSWDLQVQSQGFVPVIVKDVVTDTRDVQIVVSAGKEIAGVVVDSGGAPIQGANVQAQQLNVRQGAVPVNVSARTDAQGLFRLKGLAAGEYQLIGRANQKAPGIVSPVQAGTEGAKVVLTSGTTMEGKVLTADGTPRQGVQVQLKLGNMSVAWSNTNQDGKFTFQFVPEGRRWRIEARVWDGGSWITATSEKEYDSNATDAEVTLP